MTTSIEPSLLKQIKKKLILGFLFCMVKQTGAQNWAPVPCFDATWQVNTMFVDSLHNELILNFSSLHNICSTPFKAVIAYNGNTFHDLDKGLQTHDTLNLNSGGGLSISSITFSNQTLYGGYFQSVGSNKLFSPGLALWNGASWDTLQKRAFTYRQSKYPTVYGFLKDNGKLWIYGQYDSLGGVPGRSLYTYDGTSYIPVMIPVSNFDWVKKLIKYKGNVCAAGFFYNHPSYSISKIAKYDGTTWTSIGNGVIGNFAGVSDMTIYKDTLYLAGGFNKADGNIGNHIMKWDGTQLLDAGFGNFYDWGFIKQLLIYKDRLYAFGSFTHAADKKTFGMAYYENGVWTVSSDSLNSSIENAVVYKNEIYISGGFTSINSDSSIKYFAKLQCPEFNCSITSVPKEESFLRNLSIFPNPVNDVLNIRLVNASQHDIPLSILNNLGEIIYKEDQFNFKHSVDLAYLNSGIYYLKLEQKVIKFIKQ